MTDRDRMIQSMDSFARKARWAAMTPEERKARTRALNIAATRRLILSVLVFAAEITLLTVVVRWCLSGLFQFHTPFWPTWVAILLVLMTIVKLRGAR